VGIELVISCIICWLYHCNITTTLKGQIILHVINNVSFLISSDEHTNEGLQSEAIVQVRHLFESRSMIRDGKPKNFDDYGFVLHDLRVLFRSKPNVKEGAEAREEEEDPLDGVKHLFQSRVSIKV